MVWRTCLLACLLAFAARVAPSASGQATDSPPAEQPEAADSSAPAKPADEPAAPSSDQPSDDPASDVQPSEPSPSDEPTPPTEEPPPVADEAKVPDDEQEGAESETPAEPVRRTMEWNDEIAAVLEKRYPQTIDDLKQIQTQTQRVIDYAMPAVVAVQVGGAFGSAVIVSPDGLVLTAGHVVGRPGQPVRFIFADGKTASGKTLGMYREIDSGMMQITDPGPWPYVDIAKTDEIDSGQWVVAIGQPGGFDPERTPPVRLGRVLFANEDVISTDCTLVGGDSGGPLFNMRGEVVGIHSRIGRRITDNFHVPISTYRSTWDRLLAGELWGAPLGSEEVEARPLLGVAANPRAPECRLTEVHPPYPAYKAGVRVGDVVKSFDGQAIETFDELRRLVYGKKPGDRVTMSVVRGDETIEIELRLGFTRLPLPGSAPLPESAESKDKEGEE